MSTIDIAKRLKGDLDAGTLDGLSSEQLTSVDDAVTSTTKTWSSDKVSTELDDKQNTLVSGTNIKTINGTSVLGSGDIVTSTTTVNNTLTSTSTTEALSAAQGKVLQDSKQATLVSGTNIKTINGTSLLGNGNVTAGMSLIQKGTLGNGVSAISFSGFNYSRIRFVITKTGTSGETGAPEIRFNGYSSSYYGTSKNMASASVSVTTLNSYTTANIPMGTSYGYHIIIDAQILNDRLVYRIEHLRGQGNDLHTYYAYIDATISSISQLTVSSLPSSVLDTPYAFYGG